VAARIIVEQGLQDFGMAKRKAADRLGLATRAALPTNAEVELAVARHNRLFAPQLESSTLPELRLAAIQAMQLLERFQPRLTGAVLRGTVTPCSTVDLHVFDDSAEQVGIELELQGLPYRLSDKRVRVRHDASALYPCYAFETAGVEITAMVFPDRSKGQPPLSAVDGKPEARAGITEVTALVSDRRD
jgi:hypothetical protein